MVPSLNLIGAGKLGKTLGHLFVSHALVRLQAVVNSSKGSSREAIAFIGSGTCCNEIRELPSADITLITTPDVFIAPTCQALSQNPSLKPGSLVVHCSGSLSSDALSFAKKRGCFVASIHPMRSFANPEWSIREYSGTYCALEGDVESIPILQGLFESIGSIVYTIHPSKKASYHAAGVFASNYLVTLAHQAIACLEAAGVEELVAMQVILQLMQSSLSNLKSSLSCQKSLTGPIQRGDITTIKRHMEALTEDQHHLYSLLGKATLALTTHDQEKKAGLLDALKFLLDE